MLQIPMWWPSVGGDDCHICPHVQQSFKLEVFTLTDLTPYYWFILLTSRQEALSLRQAHHYEPALPFLLAILGKAPHLYALIFQWNSLLKDPLLILEWVFLPNQWKIITTPQELTAMLILKGQSSPLFSCWMQFLMHIHAIGNKWTTGSFAPE